VNVGRALRTFRHLRGAQAAAQLRHLLLPGAPAPIPVEAAPELALGGTRVPFLPPPAHAGARAGGGEIAVRLLGRDVVFRDAIDWDYDDEGPLFAYELHEFDWARCDGVPAAERLAWMLDWVERNREGVGWEPHPVSLRVLAWGKLLLTPGALPDDEASLRVLRRSLASQVETLSRNLEIRLQANHLFSNLLAVVFGGLLLEAPEASGWLRRAPLLRGELRDQVHPDGAHEERSPMYHALLLEQVLDLLNLARSLPSRAPAGLVDDLSATAARMCGALEVWTHPDGEIALFSDSGLGRAQTPAALDDYAAALGVAVERPEHPDRLDRGGFARLAEEPWHLIASLAGPAPEHQPGHAHCDALSFELSVLGRRVVTDTGVYEYRPGALRETSRATRSHATVEVDGHEQAELWAAHRVGARPLVRVVDFEPGRAVEASCRGWATPDVLHTRRFELEGGRLDVSDRVEAPRPVAVRFGLPLAPGLRARLVGEEGGPQELHVPLDGALALQVGLPAPGAVAWRLEPAEYFPGFGVRQQRWCLVGESRSFEQGVWRFRVV